MMKAREVSGRLWASFSHAANLLPGCMLFEKKRSFLRHTGRLSGVLVSHCLQTERRPDLFAALHYQGPRYLRPPLHNTTTRDRHDHKGWHQAFWSASLF
ncbi:hypothetical protein HBI56_091810 [Parastagonospora nodorum]|uniref:Uncharacterized protein n=1 Tax=Phaeosphaeria nodorum (strain SN15 / ATCC MYA-4574 / FGSC 10173) TaxID=321614 RepID=A0A7U2F7J2_PHANO|nr:hypothetical protein HBH56_086900 [Parastagonospora nodorum]QRC97955.1 hypothetical protein JI435_165320 [Parastagonospora nodorum SN15]KAH3921194.1 hypothetical protein HBH54_243720 [Parastagonospora nodorum]KAH3945715.1 hypothetical protein HBH53_138960 [Parastagonospora nodorum]KAH3956730.1 hypothetical protein HBH51_236360 [Parastagonospora nodorum]